MSLSFSKTSCGPARQNSAGERKNGRPDMVFHCSGSLPSWSTILISLSGVTGSPELWRTELVHRHNKGTRSRSAATAPTRLSYSARKCIERLTTRSRVVEPSKDINLILKVHLCSRAICFQFRQMFFRPSTKRVQRFDQSSSQLRERVFHFRRHNRMHFALHQTVALEAAQSLGQHFLRNPADFALKPGVTLRAMSQHLDD